MNSNALLRNMLLSAALLAGFAFVGTLLVGTTYELTEEKIKANEREALLRSIHSILPDESYDNAIVSDTLSVTNKPLLGDDEAVTIYRARKHGEPVAVVFRVIAPDGYSGQIKVIVGIHQDGELAGVRVISHKETPGLGDKVDESRSSWIHSFTGKSLDNTSEQQWKVKKDGGVFDQFTGATITPRAVVKAVYKALQFYEQRGELLFLSQSEYEKQMSMPVPRPETTNETPATTEPQGKE